MSDQLPPNTHTLAAAMAIEDVAVVGLSGGRDSVALLLILKEVMAGKHLVACHINHCIRGAEADADEQFCAALCERLGVPFYRERINVPALAAESGLSLETAARNARYEAFRKLKIGRLVLAHHADDQAETVLFNLARGSAGPRGMKPIDSKDGLLLLRPLLNVRREDITRWLLERNETWRDDATNDIADVTRNRLRHEVIPSLNQALGRDVTPILCRSARLQDETHSALQAALQALPILDPQQRLYLPFVIAQKEELRKAIVRYYLKMNNVPQIDEATVIRVNEILDPSTASASRVCLPGGYMAIRRNKRLILEPPTNSHTEP